MSACTQVLALLLALICGPVVPVLDALLFHGSGTSDLAKARITAADLPLAHAESCQLGAPPTPVAMPQACGTGPVVRGFALAQPTRATPVVRAAAVSPTLHSRAPPITN